MMPRTGTILDKIVDNTRKEIGARQKSESLADLKSKAADAPPPLDFIRALRRDTVALIAEIKHASPSRGVLIDPFDPVALALIYANNGASAISILTDELYFQGHLDHLLAVRAVVTLPILRKDFMIDPYQLYESRAAGADAILLIAAVLGDSLMADLHAQALELGMAALVEVHDEPELERVLRLEPKLIGINNRDLKTFTVDTEVTWQLTRRIPESITVVAESGILNSADVASMGESGADAVLIGEGLVKAPDIAARVREFSKQPRGSVYD